MGLVVIMVIVVFWDDFEFGVFFFVVVFNWVGILVVFEVMILVIVLVLLSFFNVNFYGVVWMFGFLVECGMVFCVVM